jgi:hypothetical protein
LVFEVGDFKLKKLSIMERQGHNLFANLFGSKGNTEKPETSRDVFTTAAAQPHVLREKMKEQHLTHGETVTANLSPVRIEATAGGMALYFCPMQTLDIAKTITCGDGGDIPESVVVEGLVLPPDYKSGLYAIKNVKLSSNGSIQVTATKETTWELV